MILGLLWATVRVAHPCQRLAATSHNTWALSQRLLLVLITCTCAHAVLFDCRLGMQHLQAEVVAEAIIVGLTVFLSDIDIGML